jgi:hypothetical protein
VLELIPVFRFLRAHLLLCLPWTCIFGYRFSVLGCLTYVAMNMLAVLYLRHNVAQYDITKLANDLGYCATANAFLLVLPATRNSVSALWVV